MGADSTSPDLIYFIYGITDVSPGKSIIDHNTIVLNNVSSSGLATLYGYNHSSAPDSASHVEFKNNLIAISCNGAGLGSGVGLPSWLAEDSSQYQLDNNDYYFTGTAQNVVGQLSFTGISTLSDWQGKVHAESNSVSISPMFVDASAAMYKPSNPSFDNLGTPVGIAADIVDTVRSKTCPDIGCYEFTACPMHFENFSASRDVLCMVKRSVFYSNRHFYQPSCY